MTHADLSNKSTDELIQIINDLKDQLKLPEKKIASYQFGLNLESSRLLKNRFEESQKRNPRFSLRSFANKIGVSVGKVSDILNGQYLISREMARKVVEQIDFSDVQKTEFLNVVELEQSNLEEYKLFVKRISDKDSFYNKNFNDMTDEEEIHLMNHWTFYAIMAALELNDFDNSISGIAKKLKLTIGEIRTLFPHFENSEIPPFREK